MAGLKSHPFKAGALRQLAEAELQSLQLGEIGDADGKALFEADYGTAQP